MSREIASGGVLKLNSSNFEKAMVLVTLNTQLKKLATAYFSLRIFIVLNLVSSLRVLCILRQNIFATKTQKMTATVTSADPRFDPLQKIVRCHMVYAI